MILGFTILKVSILIDLVTFRAHLQCTTYSRLYSAYCPSFSRLLRLIEYIGDRGDIHFKHYLL